MESYTKMTDTEESVEKLITKQAEIARSNFRLRKAVYGFLTKIETDLPVQFQLSYVSDGSIWLCIWDKELLEIPTETVRVVRKLLSENGIHGRWKRTFDESTGTFSWKLSMEETDFTGARINFMYIEIMKSGVSDCKVLKCEETVTRYKSSCSEDSQVEVEEPNIEQAVNDMLSPPEPQEPQEQ